MKNTGNTINTEHRFGRVGASVFLWLAVLFSISPYSLATSGFVGEVDYPYLGIRFIIPDGWKGEESGDYLILASDTDPGLIGLTTNAAKDVAELKRVADQGWIDEGISMSRSSDFTQVGAEGMGAEFSGYFQGNNAKAYIAGIINPLGQGVTIIALTSDSAYSDKQPSLVRQLADSLKFAMPQEAPMNESWRESLPGHKLTSLSSSYSSGTPYYDSGGQVYGSYSSYSSRSTIHLCSDGDYYSSSSESSSFDASSGFGNMHSGKIRDDGKSQPARMVRHCCVLSIPMDL